MSDKIPVIAVVGPTASGKTKLGVELCKLLNGEVVSADSMQIYKQMDIATAKPSVTDMDNIPHHLIGFVEPEECFSVVQYCSMAKKCMEEITGRGKIPVVVGGTGLYIDALLNNIEFPQANADYTLREQLKKIASEKGAEVLLEELMKIDPDTAQTLHINDLGRIIRAIELYCTTGITMSKHIQLSKVNPSPFIPCIIGLNFRNRQILYDRINGRIDDMLKNGLIEEAMLFYKNHNDGTAKQAIGYKELFPYFEGTVQLSQAVDKLKQETRNYAKRQLTWFRKNETIKWIYADEYNSQSDLTQAAFCLIRDSSVAGR